MKTLLQPLFVVSLLLATTHRPAAQDCAAPGRYTDNIFSEESITKSPDLVFGRNAVRNYSAGGNRDSVDLKLNIFEPAGDAAINRPLVILAFGGGFIQGDRSQMEPIARAYAQKGYVAATIDYRIVTSFDDQLLLAPFPLSFLTPDQKRAIVRDVIVKASADMRAAVRFFRHSAATGNPYQIDPAKIFVGGASAGAIAALHTAYVDNVNEDPNLTATYNANGGLEGNTDLPAPNNHIGSHSSANLAGVINIAGALLDPNVIDANDPPVYSAHGDSDPVVPYNSAQFSVNINGTLVTIPITFYGSYAITNRAIAVGVRNALLTIPGGGHETPGQPPYIGQIIEGSSAFMKVGVCTAIITPTPVKLSSFFVTADRCAAILNWQTAMEENSSHYEIESSADGVRFAKVGTVASRNNSSGAAYSYQVEGASNAAWFRLKMVDKDGSFAYSGAQRFSAKCNEVSVRVYPNPAQNKAAVDGLQSGMLVEVLTADGRTVWSKRAGGNIVQLPVASFAKGLMLVQVRSESGILLGTTKLLKN